MSVTEIRYCTTFAAEFEDNYFISNSIDLGIHPATDEESFIAFEKSMRDFEFTVFNADDKGRTMCHRAAIVGNELILGLLYRTYGSRVFTYGSSKGLLPLHVAVTSWRIDSVFTLMACGSPMNVRTTKEWCDSAGNKIPSGATPLDVAIRIHHMALIVLLKLNGGEIALPELTGREQTSLDEAEVIITAKKQEADAMIPYVNAGCSNALLPPIVSIITQYAVNYTDRLFELYTNPKK